MLNHLKKAFVIILGFSNTRYAIQSIFSTQIKINDIRYTFDKNQHYLRIDDTQQK